MKKKKVFPSAFFKWYCEEEKKNKFSRNHFVFISLRRRPEPFKTRTTCNIASLSLLFCCCVHVRCVYGFCKLKHFQKLNLAGMQNP